MSAEGTSALMSLAATAASASIFLMLAGVATLQIDIVAALRGVACGLLLYQLLRVLVLHSGWRVFRTEVAQWLAKAAGFQSRRVAASIDPDGSRWAL